MGESEADMNSEKNVMKNINTQSGSSRLTLGGAVIASGNSEDFNTGSWRTIAPAWQEEKCKHCMLCFVACPDSCIPVDNSKRSDFSLYHCKGCGICARICNFGAISFSKEDKA